MGLVSSLYRLAPSDAMHIPSLEEREQRTKRTIERLVQRLGRAEVVRRLREANIPAHDEVMRAWLVLDAQAARERGESA